MRTVSELLQERFQDYYENGFRTISDLILKWHNDGTVYV